MLTTRLERGLADARLAAQRLLLHESDQLADPRVIQPRGVGVTPVRESVGAGRNLAIVAGGIVLRIPERVTGLYYIVLGEFERHSRVVLTDHRLV